MFRINIVNGVNFDNNKQVFNYGVEAQEFIFEEDYARYIVLNKMEGHESIRPEKLGDFIHWSQKDEDKNGCCYKAKYYKHEISINFFNDHAEIKVYWR